VAAIRHSINGVRDWLAPNVRRAQMTHALGLSADYPSNNF